MSTLSSPMSLHLPPSSPIRTRHRSWDSPGFDLPLASGQANRPLPSPTFSLRTALKKSKSSLSLRSIKVEKKGSLGIGVGAGEDVPALPGSARDRGVGTGRDKAYGEAATSAPIDRGTHRAPSHTTAPASARNVLRRVIPSSESFSPPNTPSTISPLSALDTSTTRFPAPPSREPSSTPPASASSLPGLSPITPQVSFFEEDSPIEERRGIGRGLVSLILPRTPITPGLVITPATEGESEEADEVGTKGSGSPTKRRTGGQDQAPSLHHSMTAPVAVLAPSIGERTTPTKSQLAASRPPLREKKSISDKLSSLRPLLTVSSGLTSSARRSATDPGIRSNGITSPDSMYSPSPSPSLTPSITDSSSSPVTSNSGSPLLSPLLPRKRSSAGHPHESQSSPLASPSPTRRSSKGREDTYIIQLSKGKGSPDAISPSASPLIANNYPELAIIGPQGDLYLARADFERERLELIRALGDDTDHPRSDILVATLSTAGGLGVGVKGNVTSPLARDVIIVRTPFLRLGLDSDGRVAQDWTVGGRPRSKTDEVRIALESRTKVVMGPKPGCLGNYTMVTPDCMYEWAQASSLTKCIDLTTKMTVAKLHSRMLRDDKLVIDPEAEALGAMLLLSACKIWWEQNAKKDFRTTA